MTKKKVTVKKPAKKKKTAKKAFKQTLPTPIVPDWWIKQYEEERKLIENKTPKIAATKNFIDINDFIKKYIEEFDKTRNNNIQVQNSNRIKHFDKYKNDLKYFFPTKVLNDEIIPTPYDLHNWSKEAEKTLNTWNKIEKSDGVEFRKTIDDINSKTSFVDELSEKEVAKLITGSNEDRDKLKEKILSNYKDSVGVLRNLAGKKFPVLKTKDSWLKETDRSESPYMRRAGADIVKENKKGSPTFLETNIFLKRKRLQDNLKI